MVGCKKKYVLKKRRKRTGNICKRRDAEKKVKVETTKNAHKPHVTT
jgi:hypothetical protein